jgi:DNA polymerase-3 subunit gamma/tau
LSYQVLARKWRPQAFDEIAGQEHVTTPLRNAIRSNRVPHAILLTGPRGVGKTTIARLLARCLNCEKGPTDTPCGECSPCREITASTSTDVQEIDAASRTSVDDVRELIESIRYAAAPGKHRIFVVDEVHMLSTAAFNALLKTLEEPPPRSLFLFATTNPEKIPFTVLSRCQRYDLRRIPAARVVERLREIAEAEKVRVSDKSLALIAREGEGSLRDAMTLLDQVIALGGSEVDDERVADVLDLIDRRLVLGIAQACIDGDAASALEACGRCADAGIDPKRLGGELLGLLRDLVVLRVAPDAEGLVEGNDAELAELGALSQRTEPARLRRMFRALLKEQEDLTWAPQPQTVLEMAAVRLATLPAGDDVATLLGRLEALERRLRGEPGSGGGGGNGGERESPRAASRTKPPARGPGRGGVKTANAADGGPDRTPAGSDPAFERPAQAPRGEAESAAPRPGAPSSGSAEAPLEVVYARLRHFAQEQNRVLSAALEGSELVERSAERLRIRVPHRFAARRLESRRDELAEICERFFGRRMRVELAMGEEALEAEKRGDTGVARRRRLEALNHPAVNLALEVLGGEIVEIHPLGDRK